VVVCVAGRTAKLTANETAENVSISVQQLCHVHADHYPVDYWLSFELKFKKAGIQPSHQLREKIDSWLKLSMRKTMYMLMIRTSDSETVGCRHQSTGVCSSCLYRRQPAQSRKCCAVGCRNLSVTTGGFCQLCSGHSAVAASELETCVNPDCSAYEAGAGEFCTECLLQLSIDDNDISAASDAHTSTHSEIVRAKNVHDEGRWNVDSIGKSVTPVEHSEKPRKSLFVGDQSLASGMNSTQPASVKSTVCIAPICNNEGYHGYQGLCTACHTVLVKVNAQRHQMPISYGL